MAAFPPPKYVVSVLSGLEVRGAEAWLVGGCVRDILMGRRPKDWDVCTDAPPETVMEFFPNSRPTGLKHGTVTVISKGRSVEVTTFRSDGDYLDHRHPENVQFISDLRGDLQRRDFTMNAMAMTRGGEIFDPYGGKSDIVKKLIRCVGEPDARFAEDALRMLRALRFSAVLGFTIEEDTLSSIKKNAPLTSILAPERIRSELEKTLLSDHPEVVGKMIELGLTGELLKPGVVCNLGRLRLLPKNRAYRWAALCAFLKADAPRDLLCSLRLDSNTVSAASLGCELALNGRINTRLQWKRCLAKLGEGPCLCGAAAMKALYGGDDMRLLREVVRSGECYSLKELQVTGDDLLALGYSGREIGRELQKLLEHVIEHPEENSSTVLRHLAQK